MKRFISWLMMVLILLPAGGAIPASASQEEAEGYWELDSMEFMIDPSNIRQSLTEEDIDGSYSMSDGYASIKVDRTFIDYIYEYEASIYEFEVEEVEVTYSVDVTFRFDMPQILKPGELVYVPIEIVDRSTSTKEEDQELVRDSLFTVFTSLSQGDDINPYGWNGFQYYPRSGYTEERGHVWVIVESPYSGIVYHDIYVRAHAHDGNDLYGRYRYVYVDKEPDILRLRGIVSSLEGKPMIWMAMRAGVCADYTAGKDAFTAGRYEDAAVWVTGSTDEHGFYTLEAPLPEGAEGTVGVILEGTLLCKWPGAGDKTAFFLTDDSDGLENGTPMRVSTFLTVDLNRARAAAREGQPPTHHNHLNFQSLIQSGCWSSGGAQSPHPVSTHPSGSAQVMVRDVFTDTAAPVTMSDMQRLAEASVSYQTAFDASFFGIAVLGEEVMSGANLPIHLRSKAAEVRKSSYFPCDPGDIRVYIEACDSRNDDGSRFTLLHEMGHAFDFITNGNALHTAQGEKAGDRNHGGYMNGSTADSYAEGFATAFAAWSQLFGARPNPEVVSVWNLGYPYRYRAWGYDGKNEELAIAAFLYQTTFHLRDMEGYWSILKPARDNFAEYYGAIVNSSSNKDSERSRRHAIELGLFKMPYAGNGQYDRGEPYIDANDNGRWDAAEPFVDENNNGRYDRGEEYTDANSNGRWDAAEPFEDENNNGRYDRGENYTDENGNGYWDAAEPFDDSNGNGRYDPGEAFTDANNNHKYDDGEPYADLIFSGGLFDIRAETPIRPYDEAALVAGEAGDFNRADRKTPPEPANGFIHLTGECVDSVLVTVLPEGGKAIRSLRAVSGSSVFLLVPDMYEAGTVRVDIPGGGSIYEGSIAELNEAARALPRGEPLSVAQVKPGDLAPEGTIAVATYGDANATGVMELVTLSEEELASLAQDYEEQPTLTDFDFDWSAIPDDPGAADETPGPTRAATVDETPAPTQAAAADETTAPTQAAAADETPAPTRAAAADETPVPTQAAAADETPVPTQAAAADETPRPALTSPPFPDSGIEEMEDGAILWTNANADALQKGAQTYYVAFELERDSTISSIMTDHSLGSGAEPGQIALFSESGEQWGPFQAVGKVGQNGARNAYWVADVGDLALPAGRYAVTDSDPNSWSCNAASGDFGIAEVRGYAPVPTATAQANPFGEFITPQPVKPAEQASFVGLWLSEPMQSGESLLLNVLSGDSLEQCYAFYQGEGDGGVESLTDANWECLEFLPCSYELSGDTLRIQTERGMDFVYDYKVRDADTVVLTDEWGARFVLRRAAQAQADSWRSWGWRDAYAYDDHSGANSVKPGGDALEAMLPGLWLSEPLGDGWQMMLYILPDYWAEVYLGFYWGDGGGTASLSDSSWTFGEIMLYNYYVASDEITFYEGYDSSSTFWFSMPDADTIELVSDKGRKYSLHRATRNQENSWLRWMDRRAGS